MVRRARARRSASCPRTCSSRSWHPRPRAGARSRPPRSGPGRRRRSRSCGRRARSATGCEGRGRRSRPVPPCRRTGCRAGPSRAARALAPQRVDPQDLAEQAALALRGPRRRSPPSPVRDVEPAVRAPLELASVVVRGASMADVEQVAAAALVGAERVAALALELRDPQVALVVGEEDVEPSSTSSTAANAIENRPRSLSQQPTRPLMSRKVPRRRPFFRTSTVPSRSTTKRSRRAPRGPWA